MTDDYWSPIALEYDPVKIGSIDGTDTVAHDRGIIRALNANYRPNKGVIGDPLCTLFVGRLNYITTESAVGQAFAKFAPVRRIRLIRDVVTGFSKGYAFVEFFDEYITKRVCRDAADLVLDDKKLLVEFECERLLSGWVPRRLGGGFSGRKEAGQLRFGGRDRPFRKPIFIPPANQTQLDRNDSSRIAEYKDFSRHSREDRPRSERSSSGKFRENAEVRSRSKSTDRDVIKTRIPRSDNGIKRKNRSRSRSRH